MARSKPRLLFSVLPEQFMSFCSSSLHNDMNWEKCIICQKETNESPQCPANSKRKNFGAGYSSFPTNLKAYQDLGIVLPALVNIPFLDQGKGIEQTPIDNKAIRHKSCRDLFSNTKVERAKKWKRNE